MNRAYIIAGAVVVAGIGVLLNRALIDAELANRAVDLLIGAGLGFGGARVSARPPV